MRTINDSQERKMSCERAYHMRAKWSRKRKRTSGNVLNSMNVRMKLAATNMSDSRTESKAFNIKRATT